MRIFFTSITLFLFTLFSYSEAFSQCNLAPCPIPMPSVNAQDACVNLSPGALDCYFGATTPDQPVSFPPSWCTTIENNHWFAFVADGPSASFTFNTYGCAVGGAIQVAAFSTTDCISFQFVSPCIGNIPSGGSATLVASPLTPGQTYYIMVDGSAGAQCDYSINGINPTINGPTNGVCIPAPPSVYTTNSPSTWTLNPPSAGTISVNAANTQATVTWQQTGPAQVCAQGLNCPNAPLQCVDINIGEVVMTDEEVNLCQGKTVTCAGKTYSAPGNFPVVLKADSGCDSIVTCRVKLIPTVTVTEIHDICQSPPQTVSCAGQEFGFPGTFPVTLTTDLGCDSIVRCSIRLLPTYFSPFAFVNLCGPAGYQICDNTLFDSGLHAEVCTNILGCDSVVQVNLAIMEPQAIVAPPSILDCDSNKIVTIIGSASTTNNAQGGVTLYSWKGPGIVGSTNQANVQVNQPGEYCLVVTHARGGVYCADTTCVTVLANSAIPPLPIITGNPNPCGDSTVIYTATANGNPPPTSFVWTSKNNTPFTTLGFDSIQITWSNVVFDTLCVTANNSCGASLPACIPINVQQPIVAPQLSGPTTVCANGGTYLFTLDTQQVGVNYSWTVPAGAVLTGSGDTISVDFANASSGQVCMTASNDCGSIPPICQNVQVSPAPTIALNSSAEICLGASVNLTFSLSGNGPFDVLWFDGTQNTTLTDIANGHVVPVSPAQSTTYRLISVSDNTMPNACVTTATDSVTVTVWNPATTNQAFEICDGESILLGGIMQTTPGVYFDTLNTIHGCDSVIVSTLIVNAIDTTIIIQTSCDPAVVGTTIQTLAQTNGCDSIVITTINLLPSSATDIFNLSCDSATVGVFVQNLTNYVGCDSIVTTTVTYSDSYTTNLSAASCNPAEVGVFSDTLTSLLGCDSILITNVTLLPKDTTLLFDASCNPANVGTFVQDLTNQNGCDSTVITTVSFFHLDTTQLTAASCDPNATGIFFETLITAAGCDSVLMTTVSLLASDTTLLSAADCDPANVGTFIEVLTNQNGCDSTIITTVTLLPSSTTALTGASCNPANVGVFVQNLTNEFGCDSIVTTTVSFFQIPPTPLTATTCDPAAAGVFSQTLTTAAGCDSTIVTTVTLLPSSTTALTGQSCNPANVGVFVQNLTNEFGCDSIVTTTVSFFQIPPTPLTATTCDPGAAGVFSETLTTAAGCDSTIVTTVTLLPSNEVTIQNATCDPAAAGIFVYNLTNQFGCDSTVTELVALLPSNTTNLTATTCDQNEVGAVTQVLTNQFGCDSTVITTTSLLPPANCGAAASATGSNIPCTSSTGTITVTATLGVPPFGFDVLSAMGASVATGTINALNTPQTVSGLPAGNYTIVLTASTGFTATTQATVVQLLPPVISAITNSNYGGFGISCNGESDGSATATVTGGKPPYAYAWSTGSTTNSTDGLSAGAYTLTVTDANNCTTVGNTTLFEPEPLVIALTVTDISCFGRRDGTISVQVAGGIPPYRYALNLGGLQTSSMFAGLGSGSFTVRAVDASGCETEETILVNAPPPFVAELGDTQIISLGDSTTLQVLVNVPLDSIQSVVWGAPLDTTDCTTCLSYVVAPFVTTTYSVTVVTTGGCSDADQVTVFVDRRRYLYVPNVFSPNGDGENDVFAIFAKPNTVKNIKTMQLFNRWGEAVFQLDNFLPNNPTVGWNGTFRGDPMNPAVFAWMLEVEFIDGVTEVYTGDVTIVR
ncbi:MAG: gliding motility-associated C-terminal domain-containing protein [Lewinellaceae bacterium]|nr:gliding motility-associated C-terminal domain-containing protein [Lewinellaceae bacterium]